MNKQILSILSIILVSFSIGLAQTSTETPKTINGGIVNSKAITLAKPSYPAAARAVRASGAVNIQIKIDENGDVISAVAVSGHPLLRQASEEAARQSKFSPTLLEDQPVKVTGVIVYNFIPPKIEPSNEEKLGIMGMSAFLTISKLMPTYDWEDIDKAEFTKIPQITNELAPLKAITKETTAEKRTEIINKVIISIEKKLSGADAWQFEFGKAFGELMGELQKSVKTDDKLINETILKTNLLEMRNLLLTAPPDFPTDVLAQFKELTKFNDTPDLDSDKNKLAFMKLLFETLNIISPNTLK